MTYVCVPTPGLLDGMSRPQLQAALAAAQAAYVKLMTGASVVQVAYAQGDGNRQATYRQAQVQELTFFIRQLQQALGVAGVRRRPSRMRYL